MKRRALQQGDIVKMDIPSFNKISNPSVQNYCIRHPICIHTHTQNSQIITTDYHNNPIYYHPFPHLIYTTYLHIQPNFLPKEMKKGWLIQADTKEMTTILKLILQMMAMLLHTAYSPLYTCQEQALNCSHSQVRVPVPRSKVSGSLVQMFPLFFPFHLLLYLLQHLH